MTKHSLATRALEIPFFEIIVTVSAKTSIFPVYCSLAALLMFFADIITVNQFPIIIFENSKSSSQVVDKHASVTQINRVYLAADVVDVIHLDCL